MHGSVAYRILDEKPGGKGNFKERRIILIWILKRQGVRTGPVSSSSEHENGSLGSINSEAFLNKMGDYYLLKKDSATYS